MKIPIIFSFARSGGTLANQLLGTHPSCLVLSEINPTASVIPVANQAFDWLNLIDKNEIQEIENSVYSQQIALLKKKSENQGKTLVIRDWVTINFLKNTSGSNFVPSMILEQPIYLARAGLDVKPLVVTRKAGSVYRSIRQNFSHMTDLSLENFASAYLQYAKTIANYPRVSLEEIQTSPRESLFNILKILGLSTEHVDLQLDYFSAFNKCTGNNTLKAPTRSAQSQIILPPEVESDEDNALENQSDLREANLILGYDS